MYKYLWILALTLFVHSCDTSGTETCNDCDVALLDYFNTMGNNCVADESAISQFCSNFRATQGIGLMRESCLQGNAEQAYCNNTGRSAAPFVFATWKAVPMDVRVEVSYGGHIEDVTVTNLGVVERVFDGFLPANVLVNVTMYDLNTGDVLASAAPKISYDRVEENLDKEREIWIDLVNDDWRFYFFYWE